MAIFLRQDEIRFHDHPKFKGVKIAKLAGKAQGADIGVSILVISPGIEIPVHTHDESLDSIYCIEGRGEVYRNGQWAPFGQGDYCLVPAKEEHGVRCGSRQPMRLFIVHSPPLF